MRVLFLHKQKHTRIFSNLYQCTFNYTYKQKIFLSSLRLQFDEVQLRLFIKPLSFIIIIIIVIIIIIIIITIIIINNNNNNLFQVD